MTSSKDRGFTMLEMLITLAIGLVVAGVTFMALMPMLKESHVDAAYDTTLSVTRTFRNQAMFQTRRYVLTFTMPGTITVQYWPNTTPPSTPVTVATYTLPSDIQFAVQPGFPNPGPDGLDNGTQPVSFNACSNIEGGQPCLVFYPDGSGQDDAGNYNNGVVYLTRPGEMLSSRSVSVMATNGKIRGWRLYDQSGLIWTQQ